jgi:hypothetical protein
VVADKPAGAKKRRDSDAESLSSASSSSSSGSSSSDSSRSGASRGGSSSGSEAEDSERKDDANGNADSTRKKASRQHPITIHI